MNSLAFSLRSQGFEVEVSVAAADILRSAAPGFDAITKAVAGKAVTGVRDFATRSFALDVQPFVFGATTRFEP